MKNVNLSEFDYVLPVLVDGKVCIGNNKHGDNYQLVRVGKYTNIQDGFDPTMYKIIEWKVPTVDHCILFVVNAKPKEIQAIKVKKLFKQHFKTDHQKYVRRK